MNKRKHIVRVIIFIIIGTSIFAILQNNLKQVWDRPNFNENHSTNFATFHKQDNNVDQVLFIGTSHSEYGVSPMEIYEESGIVSYNLASCGQPIEVSYYLLRSAFETQSPEVVILDASNLFFDDGVNAANWRYALDGMPFSRTKIAMARKYAMILNGTDKFDMSCQKDFINALVPMFQYHTRWSELSDMDFYDIWYENSYVTAGYYLNTYRNGSISIDEMNAIAATLEESDKHHENTYQDELYDSLEEDDMLYSVDITDQKRGYLTLIKELCENNGAKLVIAKYPAVYNPVYYGSAWTAERSAVARQLATELGLDYLDFVYDIDCGFDNTTDFCDGGLHSNYNGAKKISLYLSRYLQNECGLKGSEYDQFEENREIYDKITAVAEQELSRDCSEILDYMVENADKYIICISAQEDMSSNLGEEEISAFRQLGLKADYTNDMSYADSYVAVIDQGQVVVEKLANRRITYETTLQDDYGDDIDISIISSGSYTQSYSEIDVNGTNYSVNSRGIDIVLIDRETQSVVMSKSIDTSQPEGDHTVSSGDDLNMLYDYWEELLK